MSFYVLITVDTENPQFALIKGLYDYDTILKNQGNVNYGLKKVVEVFNNNDVKATFFVNIYEQYLFGKQWMQAVCDVIKSSGHDIQLHTHPVWQFDAIKKKKIFLNQYSLREQVEIIRSGMNDLEEITGERPIAHRAGSFGLNRNTIKALKLNGIKMDSSISDVNYNYKKRKNGGYRMKAWSQNRIVKKNGLIELPLTYYKDGTKNIEINLESITLKRIKEIYRQLKSHDIHYMNIIFHSFSFYIREYPQAKGGKSRFRPNLKVVKEVERILDFLNKESVQFVTISELLEIVKNRPALLQDQDFVPKI